MKQKSKILLPKTPEGIPNGGVYVQRNRCGRPSCRCAEEKHRHVAYYFFTRINGKLYKKYIPKSRLEQVRSLVQHSRAARRAWRELLLEGKSAARTINTILADL